MKRQWIIGLIVVIGMCLVVGIGSLAWFYGPLINQDTPTPNVTKKPKETIIGGGLPKGCVCHSKNPSFVSMHNLFSVKDCMKCHDENEDLMNKKSSEMTVEDEIALQERQKKEEICQQCHKGGKVVVDKEKSKVSARFYCPEEEKTYSKDKVTVRDNKYYCPKDDTELIDIDEIAMKSAEEPKNEYCIICHKQDKKFDDQHKKIKKTIGDDDIGDCLKCHTSHSNCDGCHW